MGELPVDRFKCRIFVKCLPSCNEAEIRSRIITKTEHYSKDTDTDCCGSVAKIVNLRHDAAKNKNGAKHVQVVRKKTVVPKEKNNPK